MVKTRVLIIDDEHDFTQMVKFSLEEFGEYDVSVINKASNGLSAALKDKPHLILLDVIMPDMEGPDVFEQLATNDVTNKIPVIFLTATVTMEEAGTNRGLIGGRKFLAKGGSVQDLISCIQESVAIAS